MKPVAVVTDSTSDLPPVIAEQLHINVIPCNVHFGQEVYREHVDLTNDQFYHKLSTSPQLPKTSQPSIGAFMELYQTLATRYSGIVSIHIAAKLSGTLQSAMLAAREIQSVPIATIDSGNTSMALGWVVILAARAAQARHDFEQVVATANDAVPRVRLMALLNTLENLVKGGRVGKGAAFLGTMLSVKPILEVKGGEVIPIEKVRTWQKAKTRLVELAKAMGPMEELAVLHAHAPHEAEHLADQFGEIFPRDRIMMTECGAVLGTHAGEGTIGFTALLRKT